jgi:hypothetical protein
MGKIIKKRPFHRMIFIILHDLSEKKVRTGRSLLKKIFEKMWGIVGNLIIFAPKN